MQVEVNGERAVTSQRLSVLTFTRWVTSRRNVRRTMVTPHKLSTRVMRMRVLCWCHRWGDEKGDVSHLGIDAL